MTLRGTAGLKSLTILALGIFALSGCVTDSVVKSDGVQAGTPVVFGRAVVLVTGKSSRSYQPHVRFLEVVNRETRERFNVEVQSDDKMFVLQLPAGEYALARVQISEGPFMSIADYDTTFQVSGDRLNYVGTWRFGVDSPRYGRMMVISAIQDQQDQAKAEQELMSQFPSLQGQLVALALPSPAEAEARLYEVMPYPRYLPYFRRHMW